MQILQRDYISDKDLAEVTTMVEKGRPIPAVITRAILARLEAAEAGVARTERRVFNF